LVPGLRLFRMEKNKPTLIERIDDGELLRLNDDNKTYSFINSKMGEPFRYTYEVLMKHYQKRFRELEDRRKAKKVDFTDSDERRMLGEEHFR